MAAKGGFHRGRSGGSGMNQWFPEDISSHGHQIDAVIGLIFWVVGIWFLLALGTLVFLAVRYRKGANPRASYVPADGWKAMAFVLVPAALILCFDLAIDITGSNAWEAVKMEVPEETDDLVGISGKQFVWTFRHRGPDDRLGTDDDIVLDNHLHVRKGDVTEFQLTATDVIHSFFVPNLRLKQDAVPGRTFDGWFQANEEGEYLILCAELCGLGHAQMRA